MVAGAITLAEATVQHTPSEPGIYHLYRGGELTYIGVAEDGGGIRAALEDHRGGSCAGCPERPTRFTYELTHHPRRRHRQHLSAFREVHGGRAPACNDCRPCGC